MAELDVADFDAVEFLNRHFPDEASLSGDKLDSKLRQWDFEIAKLDERVLSAVRDQAVAGVHAAKDVEHAKSSVLDLFDKTRDIAERAEDAERMAEEICKDIRELDAAKTGLGGTLSAAKNLQLLCTSVSQLQRAVATREYEGAGQLLGMVRQMLGVTFRSYADVPIVRALADAERAVRSRLRELMAEDFEVLTEEGSGAGMAGGDGDELDAGAGDTEAAVRKLAAACEVVDALGGECLADRVAALVRKQLRPYSAGYSGERAEGDGPGALSNAERRFAWFRRTLREVEGRYGQVLPPRWQTQRRFCVAFCEQTRSDFEVQLARFDPPDSAPPEVLLTALQRSLEFERAMAKRFEKDAGGGAAPARRREPTGLAAAVTGAFGGEASSAAAGSSAADEDEELDETAPLVNAEGDVVDPGTAEGIRLKYKRRKDWKAQAGERRAKREAAAAQRQRMRDLSGGAALDGGADDGVGSLAALPALAPIARSVAVAFDPNMGAYVRLESSKLADIVGAAAADATGDASAVMGGDDDDDGGPPGSGLALFGSATRIFVQLQGAVNRCCQLSRGQTLFALFREARSALDRYAGVLEARLPKPVTSGGILGLLPVRSEQEQGKALTFPTPASIDAAALDTVRGVCLVVNSAEFCGESVPQLVELVAARVEAEFAEHVSAEETEDAFFALAGQATKVLAAWTWSALDRELQAMVRTDWFRVADIGDQSPFVGAVERKLRAVFPVARSLLGDAYFRQYCQHFVRGFAHRFMSAIYKPRSSISELGAQQLLLDTQTIRDILLRAPAFCTEEEAAAEVVPPDAPTTYTKFVRSEIPRVELLLKIVGTPPAALAANVKAMWPRASRAELERVMALKGMARKDMLPVLAQLGLDRADAAAAQTARAGNPFASPTGAAAASASGGAQPGTPTSAGMGAALTAMGKGISGAALGIARLRRAGPARDA